VHGSPEIIYGDCAYLDRHSGKFLRRLEVEFSHAGLLRGKMPPHPGMFSRRSYFETYGKFDLNFRIAMDFEWLLRGAEKVRIVHVPLLVTNMRSGGVSAQNRSHAVNEIILALRKNGYVSSRWDMFGVRFYFLVRLLARKLLQKLGIYELLSYFRRR
jgi:glycosyltransferase